MKKQVWLLHDQHELIVECLTFVRARLDDGYVGSEAHKMAGRFMYRRISEVLEVMKSAKPNVGIKPPRSEAERSA